MSAEIKRLKHDPDFDVVQNAKQDVLDILQDEVDSYRSGKRYQFILGQDNSGKYLTEVPDDIQKRFDELIEKLNRSIEVEIVSWYGGPLAARVWFVIYYEDGTCEQIMWMIS